MDESGYRPRLNLGARVLQSGVREDREVVELLAGTLLAIEAPDTTLDELARLFRAERRAANIESGDWRRSRYELEGLLRRLAHVILSLPEAQVN